ncbi:MAG: NTP transferase domain-containing protein [Bacteroides sp.]|nr:NTP transferase domain-containing protein [Bacteroides sp.]MCM1413100.1 NTP transferase domain-containing protein [Bacteroides sp.]MCM1472158.1 NTP transferase domain-containing protein [Bacteroides sp.]
MNYAIIAAGEGSRLKNEGVNAPKPLVPLNGRPMIGRLIDIFLQCNAESISVIVNEQMTEVRDYLMQLKGEINVPLNIVVKTTPSSMHSFYEVSRTFNGARFILTTVDTIFRLDDFRTYAEAFANAPADVDGMMAVTDYIDDEKPLYVGVDDMMDITGFYDTNIHDSKYVSGGIYGLDGKALRVLEQCFETGVSRMRNFQRALVDNGLRLKAFAMGKIIDVDHQGDIAKAEAFIK